MAKNESTKPSSAVEADDESVGGEQEVGRSLEQLSSAFTASARRWELIVYPSLVAFIILAGYGFFLIYSLTQDVERVAASMGAITQSMDGVAQNMNNVAGLRVDVIHEIEDAGAVFGVEGLRNIHVRVGRPYPLSRGGYEQQRVSADAIHEFLYALVGEMLRSGGQINR